MNALDNLFTITCRCGHRATVDEWTTRPITGPLPPGRYQCPHCSLAFDRVANANTGYGQPPMKLEPANPVL